MSCCPPSSSSCCPSTTTTSKNLHNAAKISEVVRTRYGEVAREEMNDKRAQAAREIAASFGYGEEDLALIPQEANMGLSCGNPTALAGLKQGETVVDLGSGGGMDCFLAAKKIGEEGKAIGIDMTMDMVNLAKGNAQKRGIKNVEFKVPRVTPLFFLFLFFSISIHPSSRSTVFLSHIYPPLPLPFSFSNFQSWVVSSLFLSMMNWQTL
jgi:SAM-dependent methyltransferase